jgi:hypothetical protein
MYCSCSSKNLFAVRFAHSDFNSKVCITAYITYLSIYMIVAAGLAEHLSAHSAVVAPPEHSEGQFALMADLAEPVWHPVHAQIRSRHSISCWILFLIVDAFGASIAFMI